MMTQSTTEPIPTPAQVADRLAEVLRCFWESLVELSDGAIETA